MPRTKVWTIPECCGGKRGNSTGWGFSVTSWKTELPRSLQGAKLHRRRPRRPALHEGKGRRNRGFVPSGKSQIFDAIAGAVLRVQTAERLELRPLAFPIL